MPTKHHVLPHHLQDLRNSGLSDETIAACGIYSEANYKSLGVLPGRRLPKKCAPALVFPFRDEDGTSGYRRIKPDNPRKLKGKPVKYESPLSRANEVFVPPKTFSALDDPNVELILTEGEKKSLKADQEGFPCLGLVGVFGWKVRKAERLLPMLDRIQWKGRKTYIAFDSDITDNESIQDAESRLAAQLTNRGAVVRCVRFPDLVDGSKCGVDDFLVHHSVGDFRKLLDEAVEPEPVDAGLAKVPAGELDPATEVAEMLRKTKMDGICLLRYWRGGFYFWENGAYRARDRDQVRNELIRYLNRYTCGLRSNVVANMIDQLKAQSALSWDTCPPAWLTKTATWPTDELLVARNGIFHLPSIVAGMEPYRLDSTPKLFATSALDYDVRLDAKRPDKFLAFLEELWPGDPQSIDCLQQWFGYLLAPDTSQQKILLLVGPKRSRKGTLARIIRALIGPENTVGPTLSGLATNFGISALVSKSVAIVADARLSGRSDKAIVVERLLSISGEDVLTVDRKYLDPITLKLPTRLVLISNELPRLTDSSGALASRLIVLRLTESWYGRENTKLTSELLAELPGILLWAIEGCHSTPLTGKAEKLL